MNIGLLTAPIPLDVFNCLPLYQGLSIYFGKSKFPSLFTYKKLFLKKKHPIVLEEVRHYVNVYVKHRDGL